MGIKKYDDPINDIHKNIINEFGTIAHASQSLTCTPKTVYNWIHNGINSLARKRIEAKGYNPDTFKPVPNVENNEISA